jgi:hypothetical protein
MDQRPIKEEDSSSGGKITYFSWGLRHTAGSRYSPSSDDSRERKQTPIEAVLQEWV